MDAAPGKIAGRGARLAVRLCGTARPFCGPRPETNTRETIRGWQSQYAADACDPDAVRRGVGKHPSASGACSV